MIIQPGSGYGFSSSGYGVSMDMSEPFPGISNPDVPEVLHPFKIVKVGIRTSGGSKSITYQVQSGTINNLVPLIDDYITSTKVKLDRVTDGKANPPTGELVSSNFDAATKKSYITLRAGPNLTTKVYPDKVDTTNQYPVIIGGNQVTADSDTWGFLVIGTITVDNISNPTIFTISQNITGSLWADRIKMGTETAAYYYARI